jgi:hypothetical protein
MQVCRRGLPPCVPHARSLGVTQRSWQDLPATHPEVLFFETSPEPSLVRQLLPTRGATFSCQHPSPQGGIGLHLLLPNKGGKPRFIPGNALPREELAGGSAVGIVPGPLQGDGSGRRGATMAELPKIPVEEFSRHLREALSQEQPLPSPCLWCHQLCAAFHWFTPTSCGRWYAMALAICSPDSSCLRLLPTSGLTDGSSPVGNGGRPAGSASVWPPLGEFLSFPFVERAKRRVIGPPGPVHKHKTKPLSVDRIILKAKPPSMGFKQ